MFLLCWLFYPLLPVCCYRQLYLDSHKIQFKASSEQPIIHENQSSFGWELFLTGSYPEVAECYIRLLMQSDQTEMTLLWFLNTNAEYRLDKILEVRICVSFGNVSSISLHFCTSYLSNVPTRKLCKVAAKTHKQIWEASG